MLVEGLVRGGAALEEGRRGIVVLGEGASVVVLHLVVVPGDDPREPRVRGLEVGIRLVQGELEAIPLEGLGLRLELGGERGVANAAPSDAVLVDVVSQVDDDVQVLLGHVAVRGIEPVIPLLTGRDGEAQLLEGREPGRGRLRPANRTVVAPDVELIEVLPAGPEPGHLGMDRMGQLRPGDGGSLPDDIVHAGIRRDPPLDQHVHRRHPAAVQRVRGQARPQDDALGPRIPRGDPEREGVGPE